ncbi:MAG: Wzy polymerase domain-containing protein [Burkholderiaceae bacterium]|nr:Wzy polymerase domain-containing protein [Sulfuritalea sp.]MCF8176180.1 Wzy polymerase domain-containing protein [Burkholderiaceae bacterium]
MPIVGFWSEWWAGALGLTAAATGLIALRSRSFALPRVLAVPTVLLFTLLLQFAIGRLVFPQVGLLYAVYLLWAGLLMVLGRHLADTVGLDRLVDVLAVGFVLGALIGAAVGLAQWTGIAHHASWIFPKLGSSVYGNLGQPNHYSQYSWLGVASAFYLCARGYLSRPFLWVLIVLIAFSSVLSGSRSVFIYPAVLFLAIAWLRTREPRGQRPDLLIDAALMVPVVIGLSFFGTWAGPRLSDLSGWLDFGLPGNSDANPSGSRLYQLVAGSSIRLELARSAWSAFLEQPWLGRGVGNFTWASFVAASSQAGDEPFAVAEHAHNIVLQLFAEFGAPAAVAVILLLVYWARQFFRQPWRQAHFWAASILGMGAVHSLLEYPLWYSYFLGPTALLLGATDNRRAISMGGRRIAFYLVLVVLAGALILANLRSDYQQLEATSNFPLAAHPDRDRAWRISMDRLLRLHNESLLSPWVLMAFTNLAEPSKTVALDRADLCVRGIRFSPARSLVTRCAMHLAIAGRATEARDLVRSVLRAFPADKALTADELDKVAKEFPEVLPLWAISLGTQEIEAETPPSGSSKRLVR